MRPDDNAVELRHLTRHFASAVGDIAVLKDINLTIAAGEMVAIMGPSGSGKSTLMNLIGCLDIPSSGEMLLCGEKASSQTLDTLTSLRQRYVGFIFQRYQLLPWQTALENVMMPARYTATEEKEARERAGELMSRLGLTDKLHHYPAQLSGGQQQRTAIARALMNGAPIILADEPTGALDSENGQAVMEILRELHLAGHTVIIVTHDAAIAAQAQRTIHLQDGQIVNPTTLSRPRVQPETWPQVQCAGFRLRDAIATAWRALLGHRVRALLSMIGIIIGIMAVVVTVACSEGARQRVLDDIARLGAHKLEVLPGMTMNGDPLDGTLSFTDVDRISSMPGVAEVSAFTSTFMPATTSAQRGSFSVMGVATSWFRLNEVDVRIGRTFHSHEQESGQAVAVLDEAASKQLFAGSNPVGQYITLAGSLWRVLGVVSEGVIPGNGKIIVPYTAFKSRINPQARVGQIDVRIDPAMPMSTAERRIDSLLLEVHQRKDFSLRTNQQLMHTVDQTSASFRLLIISIAFISLLVGGVGVMNVMLVSVAERTREIGIRLAVGARRQDILLQFLVESVVICLTGGTLGILFSLLVSVVVALLPVDIPMIIEPLPLFGACAISLLIGGIFGYFPARNAAMLAPVEAIVQE